MALLFSTVNRGLLDLALFDVAETLAGLAEPLDPQPCVEGKVFYKITTTAGKKRKRSDLEDETSDDHAVPVELPPKALKATEHLHCVERTFACLGFRTFSTPLKQGFWTTAKAIELLDELAESETWKAGLEAWGVARNWTFREGSFRVSLRLRGTAAKGADHAELSTAFARSLLDRKLLPTSTTWSIELNNYDLEVWIHGNDEMLVIGLPLRPGRNVYAKTSREKGGLRESVAWCLAKLGLCENATLVTDPCGGKGTVVAKCLDVARHGVFLLAGDRDREALISSRGKLGNRTDYIVWDFQNSPLRPGTFDSVISDLPFGHQHELTSQLYSRISTSIKSALRADGKAALLCVADRAHELVAEGMEKVKAIETRIGAIETSILVLEKNGLQL